MQLPSECMFFAMTFRSKREVFEVGMIVKNENKEKVAISIIITVILIFIIEGIMGLLTLGIVVIIGLIITIISYKNFGGVSGDVFGASNEISRLSALLILSTLAM